MGRGNNQQTISPQKQLLFGPRSAGQGPHVPELSRRLTVTNDHGRVFAVNLVLAGDCYANGAVHDDPYQHGPLVAFTDCSSEQFPDGQAIGQYYLLTLLDHTGGLDLHGGVMEWKLDEQAMERVQIWMQRWQRRLAVSKQGAPSASLENIKSELPNSVV